MLRRLLCLFAMLCAIPAHAATMAQFVQMQSPGWVPHNGLFVSGSVYLDYANQRYYIEGVGYTGPTSFSAGTRASTATDLLPTSPAGFPFRTYINNQQVISPNVGLLIYEARTNQLFNSTTPATQTTPSLATGTYILTAYAGSGSLTMSAGTATGCGTGVATQGSPVTVVITVAGTCTVTVSGSLACEQLELGAGGTSCIVTAGATGTRIIESIALNPSTTTVMTLDGPNGFLATSFNVPVNTTNSRVVRSNRTRLSFSGSGASVSVKMSRNDVTNAATAGTTYTQGTSGFAIGSWGAAALVASANGGAVGTGAEVDGITGQYTLGGPGAILNGTLSKVLITPVQPSNAALVNISP